MTTPGSDHHVDFNGRLAAGLTRAVGSMWVVYFTTAFVLVWIALATFGPLHALDPYPFAFLLFLGNVVQLLLVFVILVGQQVLGQAADRRALRTYTDAESILHELARVHAHLERQDGVLSSGVAFVEPNHPWIKERRLRRPGRVRDEYVGLNGRIAAWITERVGSMWAFYLAAVLQFGWMALAGVGILRFDPYPFAFLLFLSSLTQLILMFVIMVGQGVLGSAADKRSEQTYRDAEAIKHEVVRLEHHLAAQDELIGELAAYARDHRPQG